MKKISSDVWGNLSLFLIVALPVACQHGVFSRMVATAAVVQRCSGCFYGNGFAGIGLDCR